MWLDGADPAGNGVVPSAGVSSSWVDKSVNAWTATQATGGRQPSLVLNSLNGLPGFSFTNANNQSFATAAQTSLNSISGLSIFAVLLPTWSSGAAVANPSFFGMRIYNGGATKINYYVHNNYSETDIFNGSGVFYHTSSVTTSAIGQNKVFIYSGTNNNGTDITYPNGSLTGDSTSASFGSGTSLPIIVGGDNTDGECWQGYIYEVIFYTRVLSTTERQQVEGYLAQKWGLKGSLPVGHPGLGTTLYRSDYTKQNVMTARPFYTAFSPTQIPGCSLWMDGADSSTMTTASGYISAWTSKGTNALSFTQATSSKQPLLVANVYNGYSVVRCINPGDPVVNVNIATVNNAVLQTGASFCIFIVHNPTIANGSPFCFQNGGANRISCHLTENGNVVFDTPNVRLTYAAPGNYLTSGLKLDVFWSVANAINYRASGSATASASAGPSSWTDGTLTFGSFTPTQASYYYQTDIGEIIWFNTALALSQVQQVESYLAQKWGLTASLPGGHSHATQPAGAVTLTALTNFRTLPRIQFASTGLVITHQDGRTWKTTVNATGYANYSIGLNSGTPMSLNIYAGADVFNSAGGRVALLNNGDSNNAVRHAGYVMWTYIYGANNFDYSWKFVSSGSGYLIYNDYPSYNAWQVSYDSGSDRVLIVAPNDGRYGVVWNVTPKVTLAYVYSSY